MTIHQILMAFCQLRRVIKPKGVVFRTLKILNLSQYKNTKLQNLKSKINIITKLLKIAIQIISLPSVLVLENPLDGLTIDEGFELLKTLKMISENVKLSIICDINQPHRNYLSLFNKILVLSEGIRVYSGYSWELEIDLKNMGYKIPAYKNPMEYLLDIINRSKIKDNLISNNNLFDASQRTINE